MTKPAWKFKQQKEAKERINALFSEAINSTKNINTENNTKTNIKNKNLNSIPANLFAKRILNLSTKFKISLPRNIRRRICKNCNSFLFPNKNMRIRITNGKVSITCIDCGFVSRIPFIREKSLKRQIKK